MSSNKVIAVLSVTEKVGEDSFSQSDQEIFLNLSGHIISALENDRLNMTLKQKRTVLQEKNRQLKKLERAKTELFNMLVHDLKTPIAEIVANHDILSYTVSEENKEYVVAAQTGCDNLFRMISDLLDIARLKDGTIKLVYEKFAAKDLVKDALSRLPGIAQQKNMQLLESYPDMDTEITMTGDRTLMMRIMQNLLINAISYSPDGESIIAGFEQLPEGRISFFVEDHGPGVPPELHDKIFEKYVQVSGQVKARKGTVGLGLTFCKIASEAHGGNIRVESDGSTGSRFIITVPNEGQPVKLSGKTKKKKKK